MAITAPHYDIGRYYDENQILYSLFWPKSSLHYGFWYQDTKNLSEAVLNTNRFLIDCLGITDNDVLLDAGCGIGASSIFIAENTNSKVYGVTLSDVQLRAAKEKAGGSKASNLLNFSKQDYNHTSFQEDFFSKIIGIESICCASNTLDFLKESYRIMKPGGKIAVVDGFLTRKNFNDADEKIYTKFLDGWALPKLSDKDDFKNDLVKAGFKNIKFYDMLDCVKKSSKIIYRMGLCAYPITLLLSCLKIVPKNMHRHSIASVNQIKLFDNNMATYGVFVAEK